MAKNASNFMNILTTAFILKLTLVAVKGESISNVDKLLEDKFSPTIYNKQIRGQNDLSSLMNVTISFDLHYILKLDDQHETLQVLGILEIEWIDERLAWDPADYNGTEKVYAAADKVWIPEVIVGNPSTTVRLLGSDLSRLVTKHNYTGLANWRLGDVFECTCSVDLTAFPWDEQTCTIIFVVWAYQREEVQLLGKYGKIQLTNFEPNGQWVVLSTRSYTFNSQVKSFLAFELVMKRRARFFVVNILLPIITFSILNLVVFVVPVVSGERIAFSLTVLLSIGVFITLISENLPPSAETMPAICYLLLFVMVQSVIICLLNIISVKIYFKVEEEGEKQPGKFWKKCFYTKTGLCNRPKPANLSPKTDNKVNPEGENDRRTCENLDHDESYLSWKDISKMFDRIFLMLMIIVLITSFAVFTYHVSVK